MTDAVLVDFKHSIELFKIKVIHRCVPPKMYRKTAVNCPVGLPLRHPVDAIFLTALHLHDMRHGMDCVYITWVKFDRLAAVILSAGKITSFL